MLKRGIVWLVMSAPLGLVLGGCPPMNECAQDADCTGGNLCVNGSCVECESDADCAGEVCVGGSCVECEADEDCPAGQLCTANNTCVDCESDDDCDAGESCENGDCIPDNGNGGGDAVEGAALFTANGCNVCHGPAGEGASGPDITDATAEDIFENASEDGDDTHPVKVAGFAMEDAEDIAAYLASL